jgi:hypothetical protein
LVSKRDKKDVANLYQETINNYYNHNQQDVYDCKLFISYLAYLNGKDTSKYKDVLKPEDFESISTEVANDINDVVDEKQRDLNAIFDWFLSPARNQHERIDFVTASFKDLFQKQKEWHDNLQTSGKIGNENGKIIKKYPNGFYWVDLETNSCEMEAKAMGHCATTSADTMLSLRKIHEEGGIEPFVTMAVNYAGVNDTISGYGYIFQIKGKQNTKPVPAYHPYIVDLLLSEYFEDAELVLNEYSPKDDFHLYDLEDEALIDKVIDERPDLFKTENLYPFKDKIDKVVKHFPEILESEDFLNQLVLIEKGYINEEKIRKSLPKDAVLAKESDIYENSTSGKPVVCIAVDEMIDFSDLFGSSRDYDYEKIYKKYVSFDERLEREMFDLNQYELDDINDDTMKEIVEHIKENYIVVWDEIDEDELEVLEVLEINNENIGEILMNDSNRRVFEDILKLSFFEELKDKILRGFTEAQELADVSEAYDTCTKAVDDFFGHEVKWYKDYNNKILAKLDPVFVSFAFDMEEYPMNSAIGYIDYAMDENWEFSQNYYELEKLKIDIPYYGWDGDINKEQLQECITNQLNW